MRFHLPSLPGQPTVKENSHCAYTQKVRRFANMMSERGHEVILYGGETDAVVSEHVLLEEEVLPFYPEAWEGYNRRVAVEVIHRMQPGDFALCIAGRCQEDLTRVLPGLFHVEFGIGYGGVFAPYKVFESYAWMHTVYGSQSPDPHQIDGVFYDTVIPNYFDVQEFPEGLGEGDYLLYVGRMISRKGVYTAKDIAEAVGLPLVMAGEGEEVPNDVTYLGPVGPKARAELMGNARALLCPTQYVEPFGGVAVEAMLTGTPAISTDWGAFTETIDDGRTGFRCSTLAEFYRAVELVEDLDRKEIRQYAIDDFSLEAVAPQYERYFHRLEGLNGDGWYDLSEVAPVDTLNSDQAE